MRRLLGIAVGAALVGACIIEDSDETAAVASAGGSGGSTSAEDTSPSTSGSGSTGTSGTTTPEATQGPETGTSDLDCGDGEAQLIDGKSFCCTKSPTGLFEPEVVDLVVEIKVGEGPPPSVLYDSGTVLLEGTEGIDRVNLGATAAAAESDGFVDVKVIAGTYRAVYEVDHASTVMPINARAEVVEKVEVDGEADSEVVALKPVALSGALTLDGKTPITNLYDAGGLVLVDKATGARTPIHHTFVDGGGAISAKVLPGEYALHYATESVQNVFPANHDAWIQNLTIPPDPSYDVGEVALKTAVIAAAIELDGATPPQMPTNTAALFVVDELTGDRVKIGETSAGSISGVRLLTGPEQTYSLYYSVIHSQGVPVNEWARLWEPRALETFGAMIAIDGVTVSGSVSVDGVPLAPDPANSGQISLVAGEDRALLGSTKDGPFSRSVLASTYDVVYGHESSDGAVPANVRARIQETYDPVSEPQLPVTLSTTLVEGSILINQMPPPESHYASGTISLRGESGDLVVLARTHEGSFSRRVIAGTYDVIYAVDVPGVGVPRNAEAVLLEDVAITGPSFDLPISIETVTVAPTITMPTPATYERGRYFLQPFTGDELIYVGATDDVSPKVEVLPGDYYLVYQADQGGISLPANERALIGCFKSL